MRFVSLDIRVGGAVSHIDPEIQRFHERVVSDLLDIRDRPLRVGLSHSSPVEHRQLVHDLMAVRMLIDAAFDEHASSELHIVNLLLLDLSHNSFVVLRDPLLLALADSFEVLHQAKRCSRFVILLPELPGLGAASTVRFVGPPRQGESIDVADTGPTVTLLSNSGERQDFAMGSGTDTPRQLVPGHRSLVESLLGTAEVRLDRKCISSLGHFWTKSPPYRESNKCRTNSYSMHDAEAELLDLLRAWWTANGSGSSFILYDLAHNTSFRHAVKAFADEMRIRAERVADALENVGEVGRLFASQSPCVLVLDVVAQGELLNHYVRELAAIKITVNRNVLAAILKGGATPLRLGDYRVHGLLAKPNDVFVTPCPQCEIGLHHTPEGVEEKGPIRTFDMMHMADEHGWEAEPQPEVPAGGRYPWLPSFGKVLETHGHWLGYRLHRTLSHTLMPEDLIIVHPDQADSGALIEHLLSWHRVRPTVVSITPKAIEQAKATSWSSVIGQFSNTEWFAQLDQATAHNRPAGLIVDIFLGSGRTVHVLADLLKYFHITPFACACFVNFRPDIDERELGVRLHSLYDWFYPRAAAAGTTVDSAD